MKKQKTLAVLLAGLITLSLAGCAADNANDNTESGTVSTESSITVTATDSTSEPTAESSLPAESEIKTDESTAEKEKTESTAPADSGKTETAKPADTESPTVPPKQTESPRETEPPKQTEPPKVTEPPTKTTEPDHTRIVSEVKAYAESYTAKGFTFEWAEELEFGWDVGWMGTPRISRDGVDGVISTLKHHVDLIYKSGTDPANGVTANSVRYKVVQLEIDGGIAYAVICG